MFFQFLIEDKSTEVLVNHVMEKLVSQYKEKEIIWDSKSFGGIGHLPKKGNVLEQKTGKLLNNLPNYMKGFSKVLLNMKPAALVVVLDNDKRDVQQFRQELENVAVSKQILSIPAVFLSLKRKQAEVTLKSERQKLNGLIK